MTDIVLVASSTTTSTSIETFYTSPNSSNGTLITAFTASNNSGVNGWYSAYIYDSSGALVSAIIPRQIVVRDKNDLGAGIVNQLIPNGGTLRMATDVTGSIDFRVSGVQL